MCVCASHLSSVGEQGHSCRPFCSGQPSGHVGRIPAGRATRALRAQWPELGKSTPAAGWS